MEKIYNFYSDDGHGWLAVKRQELKRLGLLNEISDYSYQKGETIYLEEDCDANKFIIAKKAKGETIKYTEINHNGQSWIRNLDCYDSFMNSHFMVCRIV